MAQMGDEDFPAKTTAFKERIAKGESDSLLPDICCGA